MTVWKWRECCWKQGRMREHDFRNGHDTLDGSSSHGNLAMVQVLLAANASVNVMPA